MIARRRGSGRRLTALMVVALIASLLTVPAYGNETDTADLRVPSDVARQIAADKAEAVYIVWMADDPVVAYDGGIKGLPATKPAKGQKINPNSAKVVRYMDYLKGKHNGALNGVGVGLDKKLYDYGYAFNGFAARLTGAQAAALEARADVLMVFEDELMQVDTVSTPSFLGLDAPGGVWDSGFDGEGVIVGIIDSGIWPESESFSDRTGTSPKGKAGKLGLQQIPGWHGKCTPGEDFTAADCNQKLIGAQWFNSGFGGDAGIDDLWPWEYLSARDADGHGSHTASTAAGNAGVTAIVDGIDLGTVSGMAPRARIAAYKVCWGGADGGCFGSDSVAAIDQAVADGVDVLNFSISGTRTNFLDPVEVAFLFAADAGVFVAASAGNSGPAASTVAHNSPWLTTVAAGTHDRSYVGTAVLGNGASYSGAMLAAGPVAGDLVYSADVALAGADLGQATLCYPGTLDPAQVADKIVACDRGVIARVDKSLAVQLAGGIGMILMNTGPSSLNADLHYVPSVHIDHVDGDVVRAYAQTSGATASLAGGVFEAAEAPEVAAFSSRGPALASSDLLKPDILAPGVDILAAVAPPFAGGRDFDFYSGTSMSSPHIAGIGALMKDAFPGWSPMAIKSALMTTASQATNQGNPIAGTPFGYGAGHVVPNSATDPGLVYDAGFIDWLGFLCGTGQLTASYCPFIGIDPSDLNYPSITIGELAGSQTITRTVTNVGPAGTYNVSVDAPAGVSVTVSPSSLTLAAGESAEYTVTFVTLPSASTGAYAFGSLTWSDGTHAVRSPLTVRPVQLAAPAELHGAGTAGSLGYDVTFGFAGDFAATPAGLVPANEQLGIVADDPANEINVALSTCDFGSFPFVCDGITWHIVPGGASFGRISLFDAYTDGADDLDLYVWTNVFSFVGSSGSGTSAEQVDIGLMSSPFYYVAVHGWQTDGPDSSYTLFSWAVGGDAGNMTVTAPVSAVLGVTAPITVDWWGLTAGTKYLGAVEYSDTGGFFGRTIIAIDTD